MTVVSYFEGEKVRLRAFEPDDAAALWAYLNDPALAGRRYLPDEIPGEAPLSRGQVEKVLEGWAGDERALHLAVTLREGGALIGHASAEWDWDTHCPWIDVVIAPAYRHQGCGTEVIRLLLRFLFETSPAHVVTAGYASWNDEAHALFDELGFHHSGAMRCTGFRAGHPYDWVVVDLLRAEWQEKEASHAAGR